MSAARVRCPTCKRDVDWTLPSRPFCSERCRLVDLGAWLAEQHRIPDESSAAEDDPPPEPPLKG